MFERIVCKPGVLGGKPCIKGTRLSVEFILELIASGATARDITNAYPFVSEEDIEQSVRYAAHFLENEVLVSAEVAS